MRTSNLLWSYRQGSHGRLQGGLQGTGEFRTAGKGQPGEEGTQRLPSGNDEKQQQSATNGKAP